MLDDTPNEIIIINNSERTKTTQRVSALSCEQYNVAVTVALLIKCDYK